MLQGAAIVDEDENQRNIFYSCSSDPMCLSPYAGMDYLDYIKIGYSNIRCYSFQAYTELFSMKKRGHLSEI